MAKEKVVIESTNEVETPLPVSEPLPEIVTPSAVEVAAAPEAPRYRNISGTLLMLDDGRSFPTAPHPDSIQQLTDQELARFKRLQAAHNRAYIKPVQ